MQTNTVSKYHRALDVMRKPDARLIQTNGNGGRLNYSIAPYGVQLEPEVAKRIINHPQVVGGKDCMWPGLDQTFRMSHLTNLAAIPWGQYLLG